ncbi:hypothetical protein [Dysgonomonas reticulitermitis]|nr:hypothetical protein FACS1894169_11100 [Bacteroidia bacterium]
MNWTTTLPFILDNVDGDLKIVYTPMNQRFYQNGQEIKRTGSVFGGQKYKVETTDGGDNIVSVKGNLKNGRQIVFRGETINLETPISTLALILSFLPFIFIAILVFSLLGITKQHFGIIDGALLGGCGALGMQMIANMLRGEKDFIKQLIYSIVIAVAATILFIVLALIVGFFFGLIFGVAFSLF